jgi:predicted transcriptional regulator
MQRSKPKILKTFKLPPKMVGDLEKRAEKERRTQTAILEEALRRYLGTKEAA